MGKLETTKHRFICLLFSLRRLGKLTASEYKLLISQFAISKKGSGGRRKLPYVFTEHWVNLFLKAKNFYH